MKKPYRSQGLYLAYKRETYCQLGDHIWSYTTCHSLQPEKSFDGTGATQGIAKLQISLAAWNGGGTEKA